MRGAPARRSAASNEVTPAVPATSMRLNDFNGDGNTDVISRDASGAALGCTWAPGPADWFTRIDLGGGWNVMTSIVSAGDFNGDGDADVIARDSQRGTVALPGLPGRATGSRGRTSAAAGT